MLPHESTGALNASQFIKLILWFSPLIKRVFTFFCSPYWLSVVYHIKFKLCTRYYIVKKQTSEHIFYTTCFKKNTQNVHKYIFQIYLLDEIPPNVHKLGDSIQKFQRSSQPGKEVEPFDQPLSLYDGRITQFPFK